MQTFCIVAQGGGMVAAYQAGAIKGLKKRFGFGQLGRFVANSGAAANCAYAVSGQDDLIIPIWEYLVRSKKFVRPLMPDCFMASLHFSSSSLNSFTLAPRSQLGSRTNRDNTFELGGTKTDLSTFCP